MASPVEPSRPEPSRVAGRPVRPRSRHRRPRPAAVLGLVALALVALACEEVPPFHPDNRPTPVAGHTNGELPATLLSEVTATCTAHADVAPYLTRMLSDARAAGVRLVARDCYRTYEWQYFWRWWWCTQGACHMAALPGTSIHGWGKAVDFGVEGAQLTFDSAAFVWLVFNANRYGFNHPGWARHGQPAAEPWHWEWVGDGGTLYPGTTVPLPG